MHDIPAYYGLADGRVWSILDAAFVPADDSKLAAYREAGEGLGTALDASGELSNAGLREALKFYGLPLGTMATTEDMATIIRAERDRRITVTDYLVMPDYPITAETVEVVKTYRQALRDLPAQDGFPWGGDASAVPWPEMPIL